MIRWTSALFSLVICLSSANTVHPKEVELVKQYCVACHNEQSQAAGLALDGILGDKISKHTQTWEKVVRKLRTRQMPPAGMPRPGEQTYETVLESLQNTLDSAASVLPEPGRTDTFRRLNRTEYRNAVRDLLAVDVDVTAMLPNDDSSRGFDNITVGELSPTLLDRYVTAAEKISRTAVGIAGRSPGGDIIRMPPDLTQERHFEGLPFGTRGGASIQYIFPVDGEYEIKVRLARDRNEEIEGLTESHQLDLLIDRARVQLFTIDRPKTVGDHASADLHLKIRIPVKAGQREIGVTFLRQTGALLETARRPYQASFNFYRHPRKQPAVYSISVIGPYSIEGPGETPSRQRIFVCNPQEASNQEECARQILGKLLRRAYRRPVSDADLDRPLEFYRQASKASGFDAGIELALSAILVSPEFLFRVEQDPTDVDPETAYRVSDLELASRLSFFLWSSIPDNELLDAAISGDLREPDVLESHVLRMLQDSRSRNLAENFAGQWLYLRNLAAIRPDMRLYADFDDNLRQAFRKETELLFESVLREDRGVLDLLKTDYTFLNQRLAKHYGIPNVYGSRFRRVKLDEGSMRGGLLRQGSVLTVTSYATRTSPVLRGKWILENILGTPPPPPLPNVPALKDNTVDGNLSVRERLAEHRANPACASCHNLMDPVGFALENYDAVGRWRTSDAGQPIDSSGGLPDGSEFKGVSGLEDALLQRPEIFVSAMTEKLLTFAVGRGVEYYDAPAIRKIVHEARDDNYSFSSLIVGIANSVPFQMRRSR